MGLDAPERSRLSAALFARGVVLFAFAAIAVRWPEETLFFALVGAGASVATLGFFQLGMHVVRDELPSTKAFRLGDGVTTLVFGMLCMGLPLLTAGAGLLLAAAWLAIYAISMLLLAGRVWYLPRVRLGLLAWAAANFACAIAALWITPPSLTAVLYWAAVYTWCFGLLHISAALWLRRRHRMILARSSPRPPRQPIHHVAAG